MQPYAESNRYDYGEEDQSLKMTVFFTIVAGYSVYYDGGNHFSIDSFSLRTRITKYAVLFEQKEPPERYCDETSRRPCVSCPTKEANFKSSSSSTTEIF